MVFAQSAPGDWGVYQMPVTILIGAGLGVLAILRWRDRDVKTITEKLEEKLNREWTAKLEEERAASASKLTNMNKRLEDLEGTISHLANGSITAAMKAVEIKSTSLEERTIALASEIIDAVSLKTAISTAINSERKNNESGIIEAS